MMFVTDRYARCIAALRLFLDSLQHSRIVLNRLNEHLRYSKIRRNIKNILIVVAVLKQSHRRASEKLLRMRNCVTIQLTLQRKR